MAPRNTKKEHRKEMITFGSSRLRVVRLIMITFGSSRRQGPGSQALARMMTLG